MPWNMGKNKSNFLKSGFKSNSGLFMVFWDKCQDVSYLQDLYQILEPVIHKF